MADGSAAISRAVAGTSPNAASPGDPPISPDVGLEASGTRAVGTTSPDATSLDRAARGSQISRLTEFLVTGGATLFLFPISWIVRRKFGLDPSEYAIGFATFYAAYVINDPHFAVTYLLFYKDVRARAFSDAYPYAQRVRFVVAGFVVPVVLLAWALQAIARRDADLLGGMVQLMYMLVGWHYAKQGFGVLTVLSARRGVTLTKHERTAFLAHCFSGWAFAWASPAATAREFEEKGVIYRALAHPRWLEIATASVFALSTVALIVVLAARYRRDHRFLPLAPLVGFLVTIWSWTIFSSADRLLQYVIPALHSIQYLFFVWLMKRNEARAGEGTAFGRSVAVRLALFAASALALGWVFFHGAPSLLDAITAPPRRLRHTVVDDLGPTPFLAGLFVIVNIHHYFMDHVIWRRENPDTRFLREGVLS
ncbi:MAG: hypothetical protein ABW133_01960 [Polyangiaceae bacterium]